MTPEQTAIVARKTIEGVPGCNIAQQMGVHPSTISRAKASVRPFIENEISELMVRGLRPSRRTLCRLAALGNNPDTDKDLLKLSLDASKTILSHANGQPGTIINTLIQINNAPQHTEELTTLSSFLSAQWKADTVEIETDGTGIATPHTECSKKATPIDITNPPASGGKEG